MKDLRERAERVAEMIEKNNIDWADAIESFAREILKEKLIEVKGNVFAIGASCNRGLYAQLYADINALAAKESSDG